MNKSTKFLLASASPVALAAGWAVLDSTPAHATVSVAGTLTTYAAENFIGASAASAVQLPASAFRVVNSQTTTDFVAGFVTFTLSNGATFNAVPPITGNANISLTGGALTSTSTAVTYSLTTANTSSASVTLGNFSIGGVGTRLATSGNDIKITYAGGGSNVPATASASIAVSVAAYTFNGTSTAVTIDLANAGAGLVFRSGSSNVTFATLGTLSTANTNNAGNDVSGSNVFSVGSSDSLRAIINGNFSGFTSVYAATVACAASAPSGAITGTITSNQATISPLVIGSLYNICGVTGSTSILSAGTFTGVTSISFASRTSSNGATYTPGAYPTTASTLATLSYNGAAVTAYYVVGLGSYISAIRVSNPTGTSGSVFVSVTPDSTGTPVRGLLDSTLAAGQSKFYLASDIRTAVGTSVLADSNTRAQVVFLTSFSTAQVQNFIVNPGGALSGGTSVTNSNTTGN